MLRDVRGDQHGTRTGYIYGCRCDACFAAEHQYYLSWRERSGAVEASLEKSRAYGREYRRSNSEAVRRQQGRWRQENGDHARSYARANQAKYQAESLAGAVRWRRWEPHEDALLSVVPSNIAAASALGRTYRAISSRRILLRRKGLLS